MRTVQNLSVPIYQFNVQLLVLKSTMYARSIEYSTPKLQLNVRYVTFYTHLHI